MKNEENISELYNKITEKLQAEVEQLKSENETLLGAHAIISKLPISLFNI